MLSFKLKGNYTECDYTLASHFVKYTSTKLDPPLTSWWKHLTCDSCPYWHDSIKQVLHIGWPHIYDANRLFKHIPKVLCWIELCGRHLSTLNSLHSRNQFGMISDVWHSRYTIQVWSQRDRQNSMWHKKKAQFEFQEVVLTMPVCVNTPSCCPIVGCFTKAVELVYLMNWPVNIIRV